MALVDLGLVLVEVIEALRALNHGTLVRCIRYLGTVLLGSAKRNRHWVDIIWIKQRLALLLHLALLCNLGDSNHLLEYVCISAGQGFRLYLGLSWRLRMADLLRIEVSNQGIIIDGVSSFCDVSRAANDFQLVCFGATVAREGLADYATSTDGVAFRIQHTQLACLPLQVGILLAEPLNELLYGPDE